MRKNRREKVKTICNISQWLKGWQVKEESEVVEEEVEETEVVEEIEVEEETGEALAEEQEDAEVTSTRRR